MFATAVRLLTPILLQSRHDSVRPAIASDYLPCSVRTLPSRSECPWEYCSITSFTSYGFRASLNFFLATKNFICEDRRGGSAVRFGLATDLASRKSAEQSEERDEGTPARHDTTRHSTTRQTDYTENTPRAESHAHHTCRRAH